MKECKVVNAFYSNCLYCCEVDDCEIASVAKLLAEAKDIESFEAGRVIRSMEDNTVAQKVTFWIRR